MFNAKLANCVADGSPIIQRHHLWQDGDEWVVLIDFPGGKYATAIMNGKTGVLTSGHIFREYDVAESDYLDRIQLCRLQVA